MKTVLIILSALFVYLGTYAQSRPLNGLLLDGDLFPTADIHIYVNDSVEVGRTDATGKFEIALPDGADSIIFRGVGFEPLLMRLTPSCNRVEAFMVLAGSYDFMSPAKVDRQRRRHFKKITRLYPVAVQKGLFASTPPCYKVVFQPFAAKKENPELQVGQKHSAQQRFATIPAEGQGLNK